MQPFKHILFPVDLSQTSDMMVPYVRYVASTFSASLHLLFVARGVEYFSEIDVSGTMITNFQQGLLDGAEKRMAEFIDEHFSDLPDVDTTVRMGDISMEIIQFCETEAFDLLILGTHGRKGFEKIFFGSIAERVMKTSPIPVLLINPYRAAGAQDENGKGDPTNTFIEFDTITVPLDLSEISAHIAPYARMMADTFDGELHLIRVSRAFDYFSALYLSDHSIQEFEKEVVIGSQTKLQEFRNRHFPAAQTIRTKVLIGDISAVILDYVRSEKSDLIIMGTHGRKGLEKAFFGSVAERVAKTSPVPVLLINPYRQKSSAL